MKSAAALLQRSMWTDRDYVKNKKLLTLGFRDQTKKLLYLPAAVNDILILLPE